MLYFVYILYNKRKKLLKGHTHAPRRAALIPIRPQSPPQLAHIWSFPFPHRETLQADLLGTCFLKSDPYKHQTSNFQVIFQSYANPIS